MYETNPIWRDHSLKKGDKLVAGSKVGWFTESGMNWKKNLNIKKILLGESISESSYPMGRRIIAEVVLYFFKNGSLNDNPTGTWPRWRVQFCNL